MPLSVFATPRMPPPTRILVLGGNGFIGRHAVAALLASKASVVIGTRKTHLPNQTLSICTSRFEALTNPHDWAGLIKDFDVVLNCVGILRPVGKASYDKVHHLAPKALAAACCEDDQNPAKRLIHVSALGLTDSDQSGFLTSKLRGERAIKRVMGATPGATNWMIVRPSLLDGEGGYGASWLRAVSRLPIFIAPADANGLIAALSVADLGQALANLCLLPTSEATLRQEHGGHEYEFGGNWQTDFEGYIRGLRATKTSSRALCIRVPGILARLGAHLCDLLHFTPFSFGHWELLRRDNIPRPNRLAEVLGRAPTDILEGVAPTSDAS